MYELICAENGCYDDKNEIRNSREMMSCEERDIIFGIIFFYFNGGIYIIKKYALVKFIFKYTSVMAYIHTNARIK